MTTIADMNQAFAMLDTVHHFTVKRINRDEDRRAIECTIWNDGRRVSAQARTGPAAVAAAFAKLRGDRKRTKKPSKPVAPSLRLVGSDGPN